MRHDEQAAPLLKERFGDAVVGESQGPVDPWVEVRPEGVLEVAAHLKHDLGFNFLNDLTVVDTLTNDSKLAKVMGQPRLSQGGCQSLSRLQAAPGHPPLR